MTVFWSFVNENGEHHVNFRFIKRLERFHFVLVRMLTGMKWVKTGSSCQT
jgi:hypothetical protein